MKRMAARILFPVLAGFFCLSASNSGRNVRADQLIFLPITPRAVIGYFPSWNRAVFDHTMIAFDKLTHIVNSFAWPDAGGNLVLPEDYEYPELVRKAHENGVEVILGLGGWGNGDGFAPMAADPVKRAKFIARAVAFCHDQVYEGVDIDWEFVDTAAASADFSLFVKELSAALKAMTPPRLLTLAAPAGDYYGRWIDYENLHPFFDFIGFMTYDYHGPWSDHSGHNAPLDSCGDECGSVRETFLYARSRGVPPAKILLGLPFYGRTFDTDSFYQPFQKSEELSFQEIAARRDSGWPSFEDACAGVPYLRKPGGGEIVSFDDEASIRRKCLYVESEDAGGVIIWEISQDRRQGKPVLLDVVGQVLLKR